jgi:hypothetical protein
MLVGTVAASFSLPLSLRLHQGLVHIGQGAKNENHDTLGVRIVQMALDFAIKHDVSCIFTLGAFFPSAAVFHLASSVWSIRLKQPLLTLIVKAKKNCVTYFEAEQPEERGPGRPPKYGEKVKLMKLFDHPHLFSKALCHVYDTLEEASYATFDLLWKPTGYLIRNFQLARY